MSTAAVARRTSSAARSNELKSLKDEAITFLKGDSNAPWAILAESVLGLVPGLGQILDARDIIKGLISVSAAPASPLAWFDLITALIGLIPGAGDAVKKGLRAVKCGGKIDNLLDLLRKFGKGEPEVLLRKLLDIGPLRKYLDDIFSNPRLMDQLSPEVKRSVNEIKNNLGRQFDAFKKEIDDLLRKAKKTSAEHNSSTAKRTGTPDQKVGTNKATGSGNKHDQHDKAQPKQSNASKIAQATLGQLSNKARGVLGEHMADYHCQEVKGWGSQARHDQGSVNSAKLNDNGNLVQLWPMIARGRGIDAVWKANGEKPYAIVEAKASTHPVQTLSGLLADVGDKTEKDPSAQGGSYAASGKGRADAGKRKRKSTVMQMSHDWIEPRLNKAVGHHKSKILKFGYSRHVLFFSIPHAVYHAQAVIMHLASKNVDISLHATHQVTVEWLDAQIQRENDRRIDVRKSR